MKTTILTIIIGGITSAHSLAARPMVGIEYTAELQTNGYNCNWINLLKPRITQQLHPHLFVDLATISIAKSQNDRLINDLQTFSNIEEENLPLAVSIAGFTWKSKRSMFFIGIRNVNEDYFTTPATSLFTNSSCGIFPTISTNYHIANYPLASIGCHCEIGIKKWLIQLSLYNGHGYCNFTGRNNLFRFCPQTDGILGITSLNYEHYGSNYHFGSILYCGKFDYETQESKKNVSGTVWGYAEQAVTSNIELLIQYSANLSPNAWCRQYVGMGVVTRIKDAEIGLFTDYASFHGCKEWTTEFTGKISILETCYLQIALHCIKNTCLMQTAAILRFGIVIGQGSGCKLSHTN